MSDFLAIDFGSTYLRAAWKQPSGKVEVLVDPDHPEHSALLPSSICFRENADPIVGWQVLSEAREKPHQILRLLKRYLTASSPKSLSKLAPHFVLQESSIVWGGKSWSLESLLTLLLKETKTQAEKLAHTTFSEVVFPISQNTEDAKSLLQKALNASGFQKITFVSESEAVLRSYGMDVSKEGRFGVLQFGGGSFSISLWSVENQKVNRLAYAGDPHLGGDNVTWNLVDLCCEELSDTWDIDFKKHPVWLGKVLEESEKAKNAVAHRGSYDIRLNDEQKGRFVKAVSRYEITTASQILFDQIQGLIQKALQESGLKPELIHEIFLAGGSTRIPHIRDLVEKIFGKKFKAEINVDQAVVAGAVLLYGK